MFLTPLARYLLSSCCDRADHAPNRQDEEFGEQLQKGLQDCRNFFKDFLFTSGLRGFSVVNPSLCVPVADERGDLSGERIQFTRSMKATTGSWILSVLKRRG